jgi:hypothetical protein
LREEYHKLEELLGVMSHQIEQQQHYEDQIADLQKTVEKANIKYIH